MLAFAGSAGSRVVLQSQSANVILCLTHAATAREQAQRCTLKSERAFYERMEARWLGLAASAAFAERVDLFVQSLQSMTVPHDACARCRGVMSVEVIEATGSQEIYTLRCRQCGGTESRTVMRYTLRGVDSPVAAAAHAAHPLAPPRPEHAPSLPR